MTETNEWIHRKTASSICASSIGHCGRRTCISTRRRPLSLEIPAF
ncbi:hypothetical protein BIFADO_02116 [Bifidobacterium adolescentis L2-32]|uniref:Uncharacterized protein n=1 Tax=Bifidobacterium adolescentis L2-32 TaxID=411481 RepID=A7A8C5_BIFAD|nr:hypothetical protein BIFADO_02116 [Bifidobacterium adolescentis L2-32]